MYMVCQFSNLDVSVYYFSGFYFDVHAYILCGMLNALHEGNRPFHMHMCIHDTSMSTCVIAARTPFFDCDILLARHYQLIGLLVPSQKGLAARQSTQKHASQHTNKIGQTQAIHG